MHLYCMRHGEACSIDINAQQPLTPQGRLDIASIGKFLSKKSIHIEHIIYSGKIRAQQTASILAQTLSVNHVTESNYLLGENAELEPLINMINHWSEDTLLVGHLPFMGFLVQTLVLGEIKQQSIVNYQPGTLVCLKSCPEQHWVIDWVLHPQLMEFSSIA